MVTVIIYCTSLAVVYSGFPSAHAVRVYRQWGEWDCPAGNNNWTTAYPKSTGCASGPTKLIGSGS